MREPTPAPARQLGEPARDPAPSAAHDQARPGPVPGPAHPRGQRQGRDDVARGGPAPVRHGERHATAADRRSRVSVARGASAWSVRRRAAHDGRPTEASVPDALARTLEATVDAGSAGASRSTRTDRGQHRRRRHRPARRRQNSAGAPAGSSAHGCQPCAPAAGAHDLDARGHEQRGAQVGRLGLAGVDEGDGDGSSVPAHEARSCRSRAPERRGQRRGSGRHGVRVDRPARCRCPAGRRRDGPAAPARTPVGRPARVRPQPGRAPVPWSGGGRAARGAAARRTGSPAPEAAGGAGGPAPPDVTGGRCSPARAQSA